jgi:hypothetical protein
VSEQQNDQQASPDDVVAANIERIRSLTVEGNTEGAAELEAETEALISGLSGRGVTARRIDARNAMREALAAKPAAVAVPGKSGTVTSGAEIASLETTDYKVLPGAAERVAQAIEIMTEGVQRQEQVSSLAEDVSGILLSLRTMTLNPQGVPALDGRSSQGYRDAAAAVYDGVRPTLVTEKQIDALRQIKNAVNYQTSSLLVEYTRSIGEHPEEWAKFEKLLELEPSLKEIKTENGDLDKTEILHVYFGLDRESKKEKAALREANKRAALKAAKDAGRALPAADPFADEDDQDEAEVSGEGGASGGAGSRPRKSAIEKSVAKVEKSKKDLEGLDEVAAKVKAADEMRTLHAELQAVKLGVLAVQQSLELRLAQAGEPLIAPASAPVQQPAESGDQGDAQQD